MKAPINNPKGWEYVDINQLYDDYLGEFCGYRIYKVYGDYVYLIFDADFVLAGNDQAKKYIPEGEIWLDRTISKDDIIFVLIHEITENVLMRDSGLTYNKAHDIANQIEYAVRKKHYKPLEKVAISNE